MFYTFYQNGYGGRYFVDEEFGVGGFVIIEADSAADASLEFQMLPGCLMYFCGGCDGEDCKCCGYRVPVAFGGVVCDGVLVLGSTFLLRDERESFPGFVHYCDGCVVMVDRVG